jgi:hypothetical protein
MPLEGGLEPAPAGRLRRVGPAIISAASHAARSAHCQPKPHCYGTHNYLEKRRDKSEQYVMVYMIGSHKNKLDLGILKKSVDIKEERKSGTNKDTIKKHLLLNLSSTTTFINQKKP